MSDSAINYCKFLNTAGMCQVMAVWCHKVVLSTAKCFKNHSSKITLVMEWKTNHEALLHLQCQLFDADRQYSV